MQILYNGTNILPRVQLNSCDVTDNAGGKPDSVRIMFDDARGEWDAWNPQKTHFVEVTESGYSSGKMYVDEIEQQSGYLTIKALSTPKSIRTQRTKSWEDANITVIASDIAGAHSLGLQTYDVDEYPYLRVDQQNEPDMAFLLKRAKLEGLSLKVYNQNVVLYGVKQFEGKPPVKAIGKILFDGQPLFRNQSTEIYKICKVSGSEYSGEYNAPDIAQGSTLSIGGMTLDNADQAVRFAKNLLRDKNRYQYYGRYVTALDVSTAASATVQVDFGISSGKYFVESVTHMFTAQRSRFEVRKVVDY